MDAASCSYMSALHVHIASYPKLQSSFTSTNMRTPDLNIVLFFPHVFMPTLLGTLGRDFILF